MKLYTSSTVHLRMSSMVEMSSPFRIRPCAPVRKKDKRNVFRTLLANRLEKTVNIRICTLSQSLRF